MKHYSKAELAQRERMYYRCPRPCHNTTFSTLPESSVKQTEIVTCTCCGRRIEFSTVNAPRKVSNPVSRRQWGERTPVLSLQQEQR